MKYWCKVLVWLTLFQGMVLGQVLAAPSEVGEDLSDCFQGFSGTFVLCHLEADRYIIYNEKQSLKRLSPCSTFKIPNSLIGLETGVLDKEDVFTLKKWDGTHYDFPYWNHDHTLASATKESVVWYFRELARDIGAVRMQRYLQGIDYGNADISGGLTQFWLGSSLRISAQEQVRFLTRLERGELPFPQDTRDIVYKNITVAEKNGVVLMGKTGSRLQDGRWTLGWFVGIVKKPRGTYVFATNIEGADGAIGGKAREISLAVLKKMNVL